MSAPPVLLGVRGLTVRLHTHEAIVHAVQGVDLTVRRGETVAVVGESGCGKSVSMLSLLGLLPRRLAHVEAAHALLHVGGAPIDLLDADAVRRARVRGRVVGYVAQDPATSLNPTTTVGSQLASVVRHHLGLGRRAARERAVDLLGRVGIPDPARRADAHPHELSGGMRQRVMIALAISGEPQVLVADEPTTALDVTVQAQIVDLVRGLRDEMGLAVVWITHDLGVVADLADRVAVMYAGTVVEEASVHDLFAHPQHPYTVGLLEAVPRLGQRRERLSSIPGAPPELNAPVAACAFAPRCPHALEECRDRVPPRIRLGGDRSVACIVDLATGSRR